MITEWTKTGSEYTKGKEPAIKNIIGRMDWMKLPGKDEAALSIGAMPGLGIQGAIREYRIPKVSHIAISHEMAPYGLYGIRGHYKNADVDIFLVDSGCEIIPICSNVEER
jgi:hypothetical protein